MALTDWLGLTQRALVFHDAEARWPSLGRVTRGTRRRAFLIWKLFESVELARMQSLWALSIAEKFESLVLTMKRSQNKSIASLKDFFKANYFDDRLVTLAMDIPLLGQVLHGHHERLYTLYASRIKLERDLDRLANASVSYHNEVSSWTPGVSRMLDLIRMIPGL